MSRIDFLSRYAIQNEHYDPVKELGKSIDTHLNSNYPSRFFKVVSTLMTHHDHVTPDHIDKVINRAMEIPVGAVRCVIKHPASTVQQHMKLLNHKNDNLNNVVADETRHPEVLDRLINTATDESVRNSIAKNPHKTHEQEMRILKSPDWSESHKRKVVTSSVHPDTILNQLHN